VLFTIGDWGYYLFLAAADLVMILRVYALWGHNKVVLGILLFIYVPQILVTVVWECLYYIPGRDLAVSVSNVLNFKFCTFTSNVTPPLATYKIVPRYILGSALLILAVIPTLRYSIETYRMTKTWDTNRSIKLLIREGAVYFVVNVLYNIINSVVIPNFDLTLFVDAFSYSLACAIMPRFIISIRELYHRDLRNQYQGVDTGFGLHSQTLAFQKTSMTGVTFLDSEGATETGSEGVSSREIPLRAMRAYDTHQV